MATSVSELLLAILQELGKEEFKQFKWYLQKPDGLISHLGFQHIAKCWLEDATREKTVDRMVQTYGNDNALKISLEISKKLNKNILCKMQIKEYNPDEWAKECRIKLKYSLEMKSKNIFQGIAEQGNSTLLNKIYTELYITEGGSGEVNNEHEVRLIEKTTRKTARPETAIKCNDIFKPLPGQDKPIRTMLTKGVAGIGKTVSVQKFILDWAEGNANQDIHFIFPLPFRELNLIQMKKCSLVELLNKFFIEVQMSIFANYNNYRVLLIFDGLDECRLPLDFKNNEYVCDVTESTSVDILLTNLIKGNLLPSALLWITTRPAAANQIPSECVDQVTEVRGFTDPQKEEYFRKRFSDKDLAKRIISHINTSRSLHIMCHIPVFCWITATVLEKINTEEMGLMPKTLTQMYSRFMEFQVVQTNEKYGGKCVRDTPSIKNMILSLGKLAYQQLEKGNLIFSEKDLTDCGISVTDASVYSGMCTQIFREECGLLEEKMHCFVHLSIQEFLAAMYVFLTFTNNNENIMAQTQSYIRKLQIVTGYKTDITFYKSAVDTAMQCQNGQMDLFLRFLLGLSLESNHAHFGSLLAKPRSSPQSHESIINYIKKKISEQPSSERCINLFHCLNELNDRSLVEEIQTYLSSGHISQKELSPAQWSALVFTLLTSEEELDVFELKKFSTSEEGLIWMLPVIKTCRAALLSGCGITGKGCALLVSTLKSNLSHLRELDLGYNHPGDSGVKLLSSLLEDPECRLEKLRIPGCLVTVECCASLVSALKSNPLHLKELDLRNNDLKDIGVKLLCAFLEDVQCGLVILRLSGCLITEDGCASLVSALKSNPSQLKELDLNNNDLKDSGVKLISALLEDPQCILETLMLSGCLVTKEGCASLASALESNPTHLKELDLSYNHPGDLKARISAGLEGTQWRLEKLK
ncbi:hypothetical protein UPYG_G00110640 [Umbra pygmaea]|uniref:Uncharacterized protein n=1 Tax=Umbra pygmaea TaxID=75934 RepID=A0ABD0X6H4_UMBPY